MREAVKRRPMNDYMEPLAPKVAALLAREAFCAKLKSRLGGVELPLLRRIVVAESRDAVAMAQNRT